MRNIGILARAFFFCFFATWWAQGQERTKTQVIPFDVPGAGTAAGQGTFPYGIIADGTTMGWYVDSSNEYHGFLRGPDGATTTFGATEDSDAFPGIAFVVGMNSERFVTGYYLDVSGVLTASCGLLTAESRRLILMARARASSRAPERAISILAG